MNVDKKTIIKIHSNSNKFQFSDIALIKLEKNFKDFLFLLLKTYRSL